METGSTIFVAGALLTFQRLAPNPQNMTASLWRDWLIHKLRSDEPAEVKEVIKGRKGSVRNIMGNLFDEPDREIVSSLKTYGEVNPEPVCALNDEAVSPETVSKALDLLSEQQAVIRVEDPIAGNHYRFNREKPSAKIETGSISSEVLLVVERHKNLGSNWLKSALNNLANDPTLFNLQNLKALGAKTDDRVVERQQVEQTSPGLQNALSDACKAIRESNDWDTKIADRELILLNLKIGMKMLFEDGRAILTTLKELVLNSLSKASRAIAQGVAKEKIEQAIALFRETIS